MTKPTNFRELWTGRMYVLATGGLLVATALFGLILWMLDRYFAMSVESIRLAIVHGLINSNYGLLAIIAIGIIALFMGGRIDRIDARAGKFRVQVSDDDEGTHVEVDSK